MQACIVRVSLRIGDSVRIRSVRSSTRRGYGVRRTLCLLADSMKILTVYRCCGTFRKELSERFTIVLALSSLSLHPLTAPSYPVSRASIPPVQRLHLPLPSPTYADRAHYSVASNSNPDHLFTDLVQHCTSTHAAEAVHSKQLRCLRLVSVSEIYVSPTHPMPWLQKWPPIY